MFFILRCIFWLSVVFIAIHHNGLDLRSPGERTAARTPNRAEAASLRALRRSCASLPHTCEWIGRTSVRIASAPSAQSLLPSDFAPPWRGEVASRR